MNSKTISFELSRDVATNEIKLDNKIEAIMNIRSFTFCEMKKAKDMVDDLVTAINKAKPKDTIVRSEINRIIAHLDGNDLIDILRFVTVTNEGAATRSVKMGSFTDEGDYVPMTKSTDYHSCGDECRHQCEYPGCDRMIQFHDEPFCFTHSPDEGSSVTGYDYRTNTL